MNQAYYTGISGVISSQYGLDVISDNLANSSTVGFKASSTEFSDLFSKVVTSTYGSTSDEIGLGSYLSATSLDMSSGSLLSSDSVDDLALSGDGWFGVVSGNDMYYTRAGDFSLDAYTSVSGDTNSSISRLVTSTGLFVTGTMLNNFSYDATADYGDNSAGAYVLNSSTTDVTMADANSQTSLALPTRLVYPTEPTTEVTFTGNLGVDDETRSISASVISSSNEINTLKLTFTLSETQPAEGISWDVTATVTSNDGGTVYSTETGQAIFAEGGGLQSCTLSSIDNDGTSVSIDLGSGYSGVVSLDGTDITGSSTSNGTSGGTLTGYGISSDGTIVANFSNGEQSAIGKIAVYHFQNEQGLSRVGDTLFEQTGNSGNATFWTDANGDYSSGATVNSGYLESSNVDYVSGLTDMIIMQRAYQANAKSITTGDELIQKALQMRS